jgi:hypothetical protein
MNPQSSRPCSLLRATPTIRMLTALIVVLSVTACADASRKLNEVCAKTAKIEIRDVNDWRNYLKETCEISRAPDGTCKFWSTENYDLSSNFARTGYVAPSNTIVKDDYFVESKQTKELVAIIRNVSVNVDRVSHSTHLNCIYSYPQMYINNTRAMGNV